MKILQRADGWWIIQHAGKEIDKDFSTDVEAYGWADENIDDQVFDSPNDFSPPLKYRGS